MKPRAEHQLKYGKLLVGPVDGEWRIDVYVFDLSWGYRTGKETIERTMHAGSDDVSTRWDKMDSYDARCSCCWLNISHTAEKHKKEIGE